jgi:hypothetical protein
MFWGKSYLFTPLEDAVNRALLDLKNHAVGSEEYQKSLDALTKLHKMKKEESPSSVSRDTLVVVAANLVGLAMVIKHERFNTITSRAFGMLLRPK